MVSKRTIFEQLTAEELRAVVEQYELAVEDRRARGGMVDAIAASRKIDIAALLSDLSRDRLKEVCRELELDDSGRDKTALVARLLEGSALKTTNGMKTNGAKSNGTKHGAKTKREESSATLEPSSPPIVDVELGEKLTVEQLERYLWSAADILRGSIDSSDYKSFIFGLLFVKRLSDRFDEECDALTADGVDPEDKDEHQFFVPRRARWSEIQRTATDIGGTLNKACSALEAENPSLEGVLAGIDYNDERKLGDARNRDVVLGRLVQHFSRIKLSNAALSEPDMLGRAYEYLIEKFADDAGKKGGEFYTPKKVVELMVELLAPSEKMRICDPTCGSGGMLIESAHYLHRHGKNPRNLSLFGQEKNLGTWAICKMNMLLHGLPDARIEKGDTIRDPRLREDGELMVFDRVIANPPFSQKEWGHEIATQDPYARFSFGVPPKSKQGSDLAFLSHMIRVLAADGKLAVVLPHGALFRGGTEREIRRAIVERDLLEAVIGLPPSLFYGTPIPAAILVLNKAKTADRRGKVLFIDASHGFEKAGTQDRLRQQDLERVTAAFRAFNSVPEFARLVRAEEIAASQDEWRIENYIGPDTAAADVAGLRVSAIEEQLRQREHSDTLLAKTLRSLANARQQHVLLPTGFGPCPSNWSVLTFDQLMEQVRDPVSVEPGKEYREIGVRSHGRGIFHKEPSLGRAIGDKKVFWIRSGCLIFNVVFAWEGAVAVTTGREDGMIASHRFPMFKPRMATVDLAFLRILFQSRPGTAALARMSPGGAGRNKTLNQGSLRDLRIGVPDPESQRSIVAVVSNLEDSIRHAELLAEALRSSRRAALELLSTGRLMLNAEAL